jgi:hypothetical protein
MTTTNLSIGFATVAILLHLQESKSSFGESLANLHTLLSCKDGIWLEKAALQTLLDELIKRDFVAQSNFLYKLKKKIFTVKIEISE